MNSQPGASPRSTIKNIRESPLFDFVRFSAIERWPILATKFRYRNLWKTWSYVSAMEIFLLTCAGYSQTEIGRWLRVTKYPVNEFNRKLNRAGVPLRNPSRPEDFALSNSTAPGAEELKEAQRVAWIMSDVKFKIHRRRPKTEIDIELSRLHQHRDMKYERRTSVQRYRSMTGVNLDSVILLKKRRECGGKVGTGPNSAHEEETLALNHATGRPTSGNSAFVLNYVDDLLVRYWTGRWSYDNAYQYGIFVDSQHEERFEVSLRKRCLERTKKQSLPPCEYCLNWLQYRGNQYCAAIALSVL